MNYVQYGCGLSAPSEWKNYDSSPTLRIQKIPIIGSLIQPKSAVIFPKNILYGNIITGLPVPESSCDGIYCSHVLEHLSLSDFRIALKNTFKILKVGGIFRCVVPDLEVNVKSYLKLLKEESNVGSIKFLRDTRLGTRVKAKTIMQIIRHIYGSSEKHLWMWDRFSLKHELEQIGFKSIRECSYNDSSDPMFRLVEDENRFKGAVAMECIR